ncbi:MAG: hypothetical protein AAF988_08940 [Pseudomonadota bacterium]
MSKSKSIVIDADCLVAKPNADQRGKRAAYLIELCIKAVEHGHTLNILYNDQRDNSIELSRGNVISAIETAINAYRYEGRLPPPNPRYFSKFLIGYS